ncbi:MAG: ribonuclease P protein component [Paramuribaculum sp.]|nr:ribonuclease P protein component [Paramuribaculum sp.]
MTAIQQLFSPGNSEENSSIMAYPWRCVWRVNNKRTGGINCPKFLISVPKKRRRHAVDRVKMRRRMREAYRLHKHLLPADVPVEMALIYVADKETPYTDCCKSVLRIFYRINARITPKSTEHRHETI